MKTITVLGILMAVIICYPRTNTWALEHRNKTDSLPTSNKLGIIPQPVEIKFSEQKYRLPSSLIIRASTKDERNVGEFIRDYLARYHIKAKLSSNAPNADVELKNVPNMKHGAEAYALRVSKKGILIQAQAGPGYFYAFQTLCQLLPVDSSENPEIQQVNIVDYPRFTWRGLHLDVCRHFFPVEFVKRYLDFMAAYKLNTFHWHLTDDQGWRIEIKKYPLLTKIGSQRKQTMVGRLYREDDPNIQYDGKPTGGFYTQQEIKDVVAYAAKRYIRVVPEIEMPGHAVAILAAYPQLGCGKGPYEVRQIWGVSPDILCPTDSTLTFLKDVLTEVCVLFPSKYIHIGGDEAPKITWKDNPTVLAIMKQEQYTKLDQVQGWLNHKMEKFLSDKGRRMMGWDEILEGGVSKQATIMSWRGENGGIAAAKQGNNVVMTPGFALYFDACQGNYEQEPLSIGGYLPLKNVYNYDPMPASLTSNEQSKVLGAQACMWTEYIASTDQVEYMLFPRLFALSELTWSPREHKDYAGFSLRTATHYARLNAKNVHYRVPEPEGLAFDQKGKVKDSLTSLSHLTLKLSTVVPDAVIKYTLDGSNPNENSSTYASEIQLPVDTRKTTVKAITILMNGRKSLPAVETFSRK